MLVQRIIHLAYDRVACSMQWRHCRSFWHLLATLGSVRHNLVCKVSVGSYARMPCRYQGPIFTCKAGRVRTLKSCRWSSTKPSVGGTIARPDAIAALSCDLRQQPRQTATYNRSTHFAGTVHFESTISDCRSVDQGCTACRATSSLHKEEIKTSPT